MRNIYEVMRQKEADIERLKKELQALRVVAPLLEEELLTDLQTVSPSVRSYATVQPKPAVPTDSKPIWP